MKMKSISDGNGSTRCQWEINSCQRVSAEEYATTRHARCDSGGELDVLKRVAAGRSNKAIAAELQISNSTVKAHLKAILSKLDADGRTHGVMIAVKRGIIDI
jgi:DNA-binding NarL/FixJ family response regulator